MTQQCKVTLFRTRPWYVHEWFVNRVKELKNLCVDARGFAATKNEYHLALLGIEARVSIIENSK